MYTSTALQPLTRDKLLANSSSPFFSLWNFPLSPALHGRCRVALGRALCYQEREKAEDDDYQWRGRESFRDGDKNGGREDTREFAKQKFRHPRERRWPPPNPRKVYPSNLRYAPNPIYPKKNMPLNQENTDFLDTSDNKNQIRVRNQGFEKQGVWTSSTNEESGKETYWRRLLNARSLNPKPSKSYIQEAAEEPREDDNSVDSLPYSARRRSSSPDAISTDISKDEKALRQALKVRRQQTREVLRRHFMAASLSKTYSQLVVDNMPGFVDHILIQAVALKSQERYVTSTFVRRVQACLTGTKVAEIVKWMKHNHITYPRVGKLVDMKGRDLDRLRERISFLKQNYVRGRDLGVVLTRHPVLLDRPREELWNVIQLLEDAGVRRSWVGFVIARSPGVLALSIDELLDKISFFQGLGVTPEQFGPMAFNFPASIGRFSLAEMQAKVEYLRRLGLVDTSIGKAISMRPQILACDIENGWQRLVKYFKFLGIEDAGIRRIFCVHPSVFCMNLERNIAPKVRFFRAIGIHEGAIGQVLVDFPALLSYSMDRKIRPVVRFILEEAGVKEEHIGKVIGLCPQLIGTGLTLRLQPLVKYFRNQQLKREDIGRMVADFPMLLRYNLAIIESKFRYYKRAMKRPFEDLISFPRYFSYSLEGRIKPRQKILKSNDLMLQLRYMLACNDERFDQRVKAALERRALGLSSDQHVEQETDDGELAQEHTLTNAWVPSATNIWGALRGDIAADEDTEDFEVSATWGEDDILEIEEYSSDNELSLEQLAGTVSIQNDDDHPYNISSKKLASDDEWLPDVDSTDDNIEDEENEGIVDDDIDFLMKYCV